MKGHLVGGLYIFYAYTTILVEILGRNKPQQQSSGYDPSCGVDDKICSYHYSHQSPQMMRLTASQRISIGCELDRYNTPCP